MVASSPVISENLSTEGNPRDRSICFQIISSDQDLLFVESRSMEPSSRCLPTKLVPQESLCFYPILHDPKGFEQSPQRESAYDDPCNSSLAITAVVPRSNENVRTTANFIDLEERFLKKSKRRNSFPCPKQNFKISSTDGIRAIRKEFQGRLPTLSLNQEDQVLTQIMNRPGVNGLTGVLKGKLIHFVVI